MSGNHSIRGYIIQTVISVLDSLNKNNEWIAITLEPLQESEKVDILWEYNAGVTKVSQVKSTINTFKYSDVQKWSKELEAGSPNATKYELILVGHCAKKVFDTDKIGEVEIPQPVNLNIESLKHQASNLLDTYLEKKGKQKIHASIRDILIATLTFDLEVSSISGSRIVREEFDRNLLGLIKSIEKQVLRNPLINLSEITEVQSDTFEHSLTKKILTLIGWSNLDENQSVTSLERNGESEITSIINFSGNWSSKIKDKTQDYVIVKARADYKYPLNPKQVTSEVIQSVNSFYDQKISHLAASNSENYDVYCLHFWFSTSLSEHESHIELDNFLRENLLAERLNYLFLDNENTNFLVSAIVTARNYRDEIPVKFLYPQTESNIQPENVGSRGRRLPPQLINSQVIPIIKEDKQKISVLVFCKDEYSPDTLKKLIWLTIKLTSGLGNEFLIYFPDFDISYQSEANAVIRQFNNDEIAEKLQIKKFDKINAEVLKDYPVQSSNYFNNEISTSLNSYNPVKINDAFNDLLPYGDILKPFLRTDAVTANDLKIFLMKKGLFVKNANRDNLIGLMSNMLFSPDELQEFISFIDTKEKSVKSSPEFRKLINPISIDKIESSLPLFKKNQLTDGLDMKIAGDITFKRNPENADELIIDLVTERKDLTKQLTLNTSWGRVKIAIRIDDEQNLLVNTVNTVTKNDKLLANRILKVNDAALVEKSIINDESIKIRFSQFRSNLERVNFLLSFTDISQSAIFKSQDIRNIEFKYDEKQKIPDNLADKTKHELITAFKGRNLAELSELSDDEFKKILHLEEIVISYTFSWFNISNLKYTVRYNFSRAIYNKPMDGDFNSIPNLSKTYHLKKVKDLTKLEKSLAREIDELKMEKIKKFDLI